MNSFPEKDPGPEYLRTIISESLYIVPHLNPKKELKVEGGMAKNILILVDLGDETQIRTSEENLLMKILSSIQLELPSIGILKIGADFPYSLERIIKIYSPQSLLLFGSSPKMVNIPSPWEKYQWMRLGSTDFLLIDELSRLESDPEKVLKNKLWNQLKAYFKP